MWQLTRTEFPAELVDTIIDFSHSDHCTLAKCSLVSKMWLPTSRLHLFEHVKLTSANFAAFLALFDTVHCSLLPYIHTVTMFGAGWKSLQAAITCLTILKELETLCLVKVTLQPGRPTPISGFHNLKALDMSQAIFETFTHLTGVVASFPFIERLRIDNSEWHSSPGESLAVAPSTLRAVDIGRCSKTPIFHWLIGSAPDLITVSLSLFRTTEIRPAVQYLRYLGPSLEHLELTQFLGSWASGRVATIHLHYSC